MELPREESFPNTPVFSLSAPSACATLLSESNHLGVIGTPALVATVEMCCGGIGGQAQVLDGLGDHGSDGLASPRPTRATAPGTAGWTSIHSPTSNWLSNWIATDGPNRKVGRGRTKAGLASAPSGRSETCQSPSPTPKRPCPPALLLRRLPHPLAPHKVSGCPHPVHRCEAKLPPEAGGSVGKRRMLRQMGRAFAAISATIAFSQH